MFTLKNPVSFDIQHWQLCFQTIPGRKSSWRRKLPQEEDGNQFWNTECIRMLHFLLRVIPKITYIKSPSSKITTCFVSGETPILDPQWDVQGCRREIPGDGRSWPLEVKEKRRVQATGEGWKSLELGPSAKQHETCGTR